MKKATVQFDVWVSDDQTPDTVQKYVSNVLHKGSIGDGVSFDYYKPKVSIPADEHDYYEKK